MKYDTVRFSTQPNAGCFSFRRFHSLKWRIFFVLLPLLLLAGIGIYGLKASKLAVRGNAREQAARVLAQIGGQFTSELESLRRQSVLPLAYPAVPAPISGNDDAQRRFEDALSTKPEQASEMLARLAEEHPDSFAASGVPLLPLIEWTRLRFETSPAALIARAETLCRAAVTTHPSVITPELLTRAEALLVEHGAGTDTLPAWRKLWEEDEAMRNAIRLNEKRIATEPGSFWIHQGARAWRVERVSSEIVLIPRERIEGIARLTVSRIKSLLPAYAAPGIKLGGEPLGDLVQDGELLGQLEQNSFTITVFLIDPAKLYTAQRQQTRWLGALVACALAAELAAFAAIERALKKERHLGELKSNFVSSVSHELRAPVASMRLMAENLESGTVHESEQRHAYHRLMAEECRRLSALIDNVLDFARIEQNRRVYQFIESDVAALVRDAIQLMQPRAAQRQQEIHSEIQPLERVCDGLAIRQALINLLDNAIKFSPEKTVIVVRLKPASAEAWELSIADQGPGIPNTEHSKVFEHFYRIGNELCRETQGTGIGLSIVKHIAEGHGGFVKLESEPGRGSRFALIIPNLPY